MALRISVYGSMRGELLNETFYHLHCPFHIALLSDFHNTDPDWILESLRSNRPDIIAVSGDFVKGEWAENGISKMQECPNAEALLCGCAEIAPAYVSLGNHERTLTREDLRIIHKTGVTLLDNRWIEINGMFIGGLSSAYYTECHSGSDTDAAISKRNKYLSYLFRKPPEPDISWLEGFEHLDGYKLLLCHHPEYYPQYLRGRNIDLIFSGHCHGGQWRYYSPFIREWCGVYAPGQGLFPSLTSGIYDDRLIVSRGLSNTTFVPRFNNPVEIIYCVPSK